MAISKVSGGRVTAGHYLYASPSGSTDDDDRVKWDDGGTTIIGHQQTTNLALGINNESSSAIAWTIYPVLSDDTVCSESAASGSIDANTSDVVHDAVLGAGRYVVELDASGQYVEVVLK